MAWGFAMVLTSVVAVALTWQFDMWLGIVFWLLATVILLPFRPQ